jgi:hypothetical protein
MYSTNELHYSSLIPYKNHPDGELKFNALMKALNYTIEPPPKYFVKTLKLVMEDKTLQTAQKDPLGIIEAFAKWNDMSRDTFGKKNLTTSQRCVKANLDHKFHKYYQVLRCIGCLEIPVRVFCHMVCRNGCPKEFHDYNDRPFRMSNMQDLELKLNGRHATDTWNNMQNSSMHLMLKWEDSALRQLIAPQVTDEDWHALTPKEIGMHLRDWFENLDKTDLLTKEDLRESLIPTAGTLLNKFFKDFAPPFLTGNQNTFFLILHFVGQHRCAAIPRFVESVHVAQWQGVLGSHLEVNFWLRMEKNVSHYISGVSEHFIHLQIRCAIHSLATFNHQ